MGGFAVPDMRGRVAVAKGGGAAFAVTIGSNVGAETHTVTLSELPAHGHTGVTFSAGAHVHDWTIYSTPSGNFFSVGPDINPAGYNFFRMTARFQFVPIPPNYCILDIYSNYDVTSGTTPPYNGAHSHSFTTYNAGTGNAHANVQPTLVTQYIVKT
jgi:microcystin-dependent protein